MPVEYAGKRSFVEKYFSFWQKSIYKKYKNLIDLTQLKFEKLPVWKSIFGENLTRVLRSHWWGFENLTIETPRPLNVDIYYQELNGPLSRHWLTFIAFAQVTSPWLSSFSGTGRTLRTVTAKVATASTWRPNWDIRPSAPTWWPRDAPSTPQTATAWRPSCGPASGTADHPWIWRAFRGVVSTHLNRDKIESNWSVPRIQGHQENALKKSFKMSLHLTCL